MIEKEVPLRCLILFSALSLTSTTGQATTIIFKVDATAIYVVADNRAGLSIDGKPSQVSDRSCKIISLGQTTVAVAGEVSRFQNLSVRPELAQDAFSDVRTAFAAVGDDDLDRLAEKWSGLSAKHTSEYYNSHPDLWIRDLEPVSEKNLATGVFLGWRQHQPEVKLTDVRWQNHEFEAVNLVFSHPLEEHSLNPLTQELIDGNTSRAKDTARRWQTISRQYSPTEQVWRHMMFLVSETSKIDPTVSPSSDVRRVMKSGKMDWLHNSVCK